MELQNIIILLLTMVFGLSRQNISRQYLIKVIKRKEDGRCMTLTGSSKNSPLEMQVVRLANTQAGGTSIRAMDSAKSSNTSVHAFGAPRQKEYEKPSGTEAVLPMRAISSLDSMSTLRRPHVGRSL